MSRRTLAGAVAVGVAVVGVILAAAFANVIYGTHHAPQHSGGVRVSEMSSGTVIHDPWCERSEDSCAIDYRRNGTWVVSRVVP